MRFRNPDVIQAVSRITCFEKYGASLTCTLIRCQTSCNSSNADMLPGSVKTNYSEF